MITPKTLSEWEQYLRPRFAAVQLIGELNLTEDQTHEIGKLIRGLLRRVQLTEANRCLEQNYPCTLATYLVFAGVYEYHDHKFWASVCEATGLPPNSSAQNEWGQIFEGVLEVFALKRHFGNQTYRFVSPILGHGGIPIDCLPAFFDHMVQPSVEDFHQAERPTTTLIHRLKTDLQHIGVVKPISRFLEHGGQLAVDYVERCRDMARETLATGIVPLPATLALPSAVVHAYQKWLEERAASQGSTTAVNQRRDQAARYRRPQLCLDPWGQGVYWRLPVQYLATNFNAKLPNVTWELISGNSVQVLSTRLYYESGRWCTEEQFVRITTHAEATVRARFLVENSEQRVWQLDEFPVRPHYPFFAFSPDTGELLPRQEILQARPIWLLLAPDFQVAQTDLITEQLPQLPDSWSNWKLVEVDLSTATTLILKWDTKELTFPVVSVIEPTLVGTPLHLGPQAITIYNYTPPALEFPSDTSDSLSSWRLDLYQELEGTAIQLYHGSVADLNEELVDKNGVLTLPLSLPKLLDKTPFGQFRIRVHNPLDHVTEFRFAVISHLTIVGNEQLYLPNPETGASAITLLAEVDAKTCLIAGDSQPDLPVTCLEFDEQYRLYELTLAPGTVQAQLKLQRTSNTMPVSVPFTLTVRRLRWALQLMPTVRIWHDTHIILSLQELEESLEPWLLIDLPAWQESSPQVTLCFIDDQDKLLSKLTNSRILHNSNIWRFDLRNVATTLRHSAAASVRVKLNISDLESKSQEPLEQLVLHIQRTLHLQSIMLDATWSNSMVHVAASWSPNPIVRNRNIQLWSLTRPWQPAIILPIPDSAVDQATYTLPASSLPGGQYQATMSIADPWMPEPPTTYPPVDAHSLTLGSLTERLAELSTSSPSPKITFEQFLERALIQQFLGNSKAAERDVSWCGDHLLCATWQQRRVLLETFKEYPQAKLLRFRLLDNMFLKTTLQDQQAKLIHPEDWEWLRSELMSLIPQAQLSPECGILLLQFQDHQLRMTTLQRMIKLTLPIGISSVVKLLESKEICLPEAISLLELNLSFSLHQLATFPATPNLEQLLGGLEQAHPTDIAKYFIRTGYWVHCQTGWGRIEQIQSEDNTFSTYLSLSQLYNGVWLHIKLRADTDDEEMIILDMGNSLVRFVDGSKLYLCAKCNQWATTRQEALYYKHNSRIHNGIHSAIALTSKDVLTQMFEPEFSVTKPDDIWQ